MDCAWALAIAPATIAQMMSSRFAIPSSALKKITNAA
jgi:hypothetical protein